MEVTQQFGVREERMYAVDLEIWMLTLEIFLVKALYLKFTSLLSLLLAQNPSEIGTHKLWFSASQAQKLSSLAPKKKIIYKTYGSPYFCLIKSWQNIAKKIKNKKRSQEIVVSPLYLHLLK